MHPPLCRQQEQQDPGSAPNAGPACDPRIEEMQRLTRVDVLAGLLREVQPGHRDKDRKVGGACSLLVRALLRGIQAGQCDVTAMQWWKCAASSPPLAP